MRQQAMRALYEGSLTEPGDRNPYAGGSLVLAKLWLRGYTRMFCAHPQRAGDAALSRRVPLRAS